MKLTLNENIRWIARDHDGELWAFKEKPYFHKGLQIWMVSSGLDYSAICIPFDVGMFKMPDDFLDGPTETAIVAIKDINFYVG